MAKNQPKISYTVFVVLVKLLSPLFISA
jgi:hypothetical protein